MTDFQPVIDYVNQTWPHITVHPVDHAGLLGFTFNKYINVSVNSPHYGNKGAWGALIVTKATNGFPEFVTKSGDLGTVDDVVKWIDKKLNPTEHDLNEAWGV